MSVTKLFGALDHEFQLDLERGITIIQGANGTGKTTILRSINELCRGLPSSLLRLRFDQIRLTFDDDSSLLAKKQRSHIQLELFLGSRRAEKFNTKQLHSTNYRIVLPNFELPAGQWHAQWPESGQAVFSDESVAYSTGAIWPSHEQALLSGMFSSPSEASVPDWLKRLWAECRCTFIEEQRLLRVEENRKRGKPSFKRVVEDYAEKLKTRITAALGAYGQHSQQLDRTFPGRVLDALGAAPPDPTEVTRRLEQNERRRAELVGAGLVEKSSLPWYDDRKLANAEVARMMSVFVADTAEKLAQFDDIYRRISLFEQLLNSHFVRKQVKVSKDAGLTLTIPGSDEKLDPAALSSGEQHLLVLFFELIFGEAQQDQLVMIDEPELSLHPAWQLRFIDDLERVRQVSPVDFLLATHSPQIIGDKWSLTRKLAVQGQE